ncbi:hypothetical protein JGR78_00675 [Paracoccus sp. MC1862]|nr:hypothetical protein JGR78_00675 [Paracoccus sp. MC1862]
MVVELSIRLRMRVTSPANDGAIIRSVGALLRERNDEWAVQRARCMALETIRAMRADPVISLPAAAS